jgi:2-methylisocitrate lyase-like PEP mutase family enzyme
MSDLSPDLNLKTRLASKGPAILAPGAYDALSALLVEQAGFEAIYMSGASISYTQIGRSDVGLMSANQVADVVSRVRDRVRIPLIVDADTGFGNALNVQHTVRLFERMGANALQLEDQTSPKRCGHLAGKDLISAGEMAGKVRAAVDARKSEETLIIARTDAIAVEGFSQALDRAALYRDAGADVIFVEAPQTLDQMQAICTALPSTPLLANMVEGGRTPILTADQLSDMGFSIVISPGSMVRAHAYMAQEFLRQLKANGTTALFRDRMLDFNQINVLLGLPDLLADGQRYDASGRAAAE